MSSTPKYHDRVMETSTTTGTTDYALGGAVTGHNGFALLGDGFSCYYCAIDVDGDGNPSGDIEIGLGTYVASGPTLTRDTILNTTVSGTYDNTSPSKVSWAAGTRRIFLTVPAAYTPPTDLVFGGLLKGSKYVPVPGSNLATGDTDLYTVPTGRAAIVFLVTHYNGGAGNITYFTQVKVSGTYYRISSGSGAITAGNSASSGNHYCYLNAGEILAINTITNSGLNAFYWVVEFDADSPVRQGRLLGPSSGDNTLYTCPSGKSAAVLSSVGVAPNTTSFGGFIADAGGTRNYYLHRVPSGGSPATGNRTSSAAAVAASSRSVGFSGVAGLAFAAGDFLNLNVDTGNAAQVAFVLVVESPNP